MASELIHAPDLRAPEHPDTTTFYDPTRQIFLEYTPLESVPGYAAENAEDAIKSLGGKYDNQYDRLDTETVEMFTMQGDIFLKYRVYGVTAIDRNHMDYPTELLRALRKNYPARTWTPCRDGVNARDDLEILNQVEGDRSVPGGELELIRLSHTLEQFLDDPADWFDAADGHPVTAQEVVDELFSHIIITAFEETRLPAGLCGQPVSFILNRTKNLLYATVGSGYDTHHFSAPVPELIEFSHPKNTPSQVAINRLTGWRITPWNVSR